MKNYYHILGVARTATTDEIKTAFRKLSKKLHPDVNEGDPFFAERFRDIQQAYDVLVDEQKRKTYDLKLANLYKGLDNDLYEALRKRKEERKKAEEQKRKEEEERLAEEERLKAEQELRWQQEAEVRRRARRRRQRIFVALLLVFVLAVSGFFLYQYVLPKGAGSLAQSDSLALTPIDTVQVSKQDTLTQPDALEKDRRLRKLNGRWRGTIYHFIKKEDMPVTFRANASARRFTVSYSATGCQGKWEVVKIDSLSFHFQETITKGEDSCTQGGRIVLSQYKKGQYQYSYYWPNEKTLNASGILFKK